MVHTLQSSVNLADVQPGKLAEQMEDHKVNEKQAVCRQNGWSFAPFVMESGIKSEEAQCCAEARYAVGYGSFLYKQGSGSHHSKPPGAGTHTGLSRQKERGFPLVLGGKASSAAADGRFAF